jgi:protein-disulfide isomerase
VSEKDKRCPSKRGAMEKIRKLEHSNITLYDTGNQAMTAQGEWKRKYEKKTQELRKALQEYKELELRGALER